MWGQRFCFNGLYNSWSQFFRATILSNGITSTSTEQPLFACLQEVYSFFLKSEVRENHYCNEKFK